MSHHCTAGYTTDKARYDWLAYKGLPANEAKQAASSSLYADLDVTKPLYFWQLYSILGHHKIEAIIRAFYTRVFGDSDAPWFQQAFTQIFDFEHHVATQTQFWRDAFGGGKQYHGGDGRLNFHHTHNAASVMNADGAERWMFHMTLALNNDVDLTKCDPRVKDVIVDFLRWRMEHYAKQHGWKFNLGDFDDLSPDKNAFFFKSELQKFPISRLKRIAKVRKLSTVGFVEKSEFIDLLASKREDMEQMPLGRLRSICQSHNIQTRNLLEKYELVDALDVMNS